MNTKLIAELREWAKEGKPEDLAEKGYEWAKEDVREILSRHHPTKTADIVKELRALVCFYGGPEGLEIAQEIIRKHEGAK